MNKLEFARKRTRKGEMRSGKMVRKRGKRIKARREGKLRKGRKK